MAYSSLYHNTFNHDNDLLDYGSLSLKLDNSTRVTLDDDDESYFSYDSNNIRFQ